MSYSSQPAALKGFARVGGGWVFWARFVGVWARSWHLAVRGSVAGLDGRVHVSRGRWTPAGKGVIHAESSLSFAGGAAEQIEMDVRRPRLRAVGR